LGIENVAAAIRSAFPTAEWDGPTHAHGGLDECTGILFDFHEVEGYNFVHVSVNGTRDPIPLLLGLVNANNWVILDIQNGEFIDPANPSHQGWLGYRSLVQSVGRGEARAE
jgi:hypothetical protein